MKRLKYWLSFLFDVTLLTRKGDLDHELVVIKRKGKKELNTKGVNYSYGSLGYLLEDFFFLLSHEYTDFYPKKALVLGLGGGSVLHVLKKYYPDAEITFVEKDMTVIEIAYSKFKIDKHFKFNLHYGDAYEYVKKQSNTFDLILNDVFINDKVPERIKSKEYLKNLKGMCRPNGIVAFNKIESLENEGVSFDVFKNVFLDTFPGSCDFEKEYYSRKSHIFYTRIDNQLPPLKTLT